MQIGQNRTVRRGRHGQRPLCSVAAAALFNPCSALAHLSVNSPSMLLAAAFPCWLWAEELPKITRRALLLVGHSLWWPRGRPPCSLQAPGPPVSLPRLSVADCSTPTPHPPHPSHKTPSSDCTFPFIAVRGSPGEWRHHYVLGSPARFHPGALVPPCPCRPC